MLNRRTWTVLICHQNMIIHQVSRSSFSRPHLCLLVPQLNKLVREQHLLEPMFHQPFALTTPCLEQCIYWSHTACVCPVHCLLHFLCNNVHLLFHNKTRVFPYAAFSLNCYCVCEYGDCGSLELVDKFCYLCDMLSVDQDADAAVEAEVQKWWNKFRKLMPLLSNKGFWAHLMWGKLYRSCVWNCMLCGSVSWSTMSENDLALQWARTRMIRWMCDVKLTDGFICNELEGKISYRWYIITVVQVESILACFKKGCEWLVKKCMDYEMGGVIPRGRPKKLEPWDCRKRLSNNNVRKMLWTIGKEES